MSFHSINPAAHHASAPHAPARSGTIGRAADSVLMVVMAGAVVMYIGLGSGLVLPLFNSVIGIPLALLLWTSVPLAAVLVPLRASFAVLRLFLSPVAALGLSAMVAAGVVYASDTFLKSGPDGTQRAAALMAGQSPWTPMALPEQPTVGFYVQSDVAGALDCADLCRSLLHEGRVSAVVVMSEPTQMNARYALRPDGGACPAGSHAFRRDPQICVDTAPDAKPQAVIGITRTAVPTGTTDILGLWDFSVRSGAFAQTTTFVQSYVQHRGGLVAPNPMQAHGQQVWFRSQTRVKEFSVFDFPNSDSSSAQQADLPVSWDLAVRHILR